MIHPIFTCHADSRMGGSRYLLKEVKEEYTTGLSLHRRSGEVAVASFVDKLNEADE